MLDVRRLRLLGELSRRGTIAEVAKAVGYTPSAVSQSLAQLEREAGGALLGRDGRRGGGAPATPTSCAPCASTSPRTASLCCARASSTCSCPRATTTCRRRRSAASS